ncbi:MAG: hypothetical protein IJY63_04625 [Clostridia bacterium]|nr:hypothetical protein [Clostridia bacterium]
MTNKEIEQKLQESADKVEMRDFDEIWQEIGPRIVAEQKKRRIRWWLPIAASFLAVAVTAAIVLPQVLNGNDEEIRYLDSELEKKVVDKTDFFTYIDQSDLEIVDLSSFEFFNASIYHTIDNETKGGYIEAYKEQTGVVHYFTLIFYDTSVEFSDTNFSELDLSYTTETGLHIAYKYNQLNGIYFVATEYKNVDYYMKYTLNGGEITEFFEEFFQ